MNTVPRSLRIVLTCALSVTSFLGVPQVAHADQEGKTGRAVRLTVNTQGSDKYASFHGSLAIRKSGSSKTEMYFWGGSTCPAQRLSEPEVALLAGAMGTRTNVAPRFRNSEGARGTRCLVAFELVTAGG